MPEQKFVIYALVDPFTNEIRYVGKTNANPPERRLLGHIFSSKKNIGSNHKIHCHFWILKLAKQGAVPVFRILHRGVGAWQEVERQLIAEISKTNNLTNHTAGGEGGDFSGPQGDDVKRRISYALSIRHVDPFTRLALREAMKKRVFTAEHRRNISVAGKGRITSAETRAKISAAGFGRRHSPETLARMSASMMGVNLGKKYKKKASA